LLYLFDRILIAPKIVYEISTKKGKLLLFREMAIDPALAGIYSFILYFGRKNC
jgi:hypothetical protein